MSDLDLLVRASRLYFELGETQERVAELLGVTRPQVSRLLKEARERGVVEIRIIDRSSETDEVATRLRERFDLRHVEIVARLAGPDDLTHRLIGRAAAQLFRAAVREGMVVGVGGGATVGAVVNALSEAFASDNPPPMITAVPLAGGIGPGFGANEPTRNLARAMGGFAQEIPAPGLVDSQATRDALLTHPAVQNILRMWERLDIAIYGIGGGAWAGMWMDDDVLARLEQEGAIGEILIRPYDIYGRPCAAFLAERTIGLAMDDLRRVPVGIAVAGGRGKAGPILGALRAGLVQTLVTDRQTAEQVLALDEETQWAADDAGRQQEQPLAAAAATEER